MKGKQYLERIGGIPKAGRRFNLENLGEVEVVEVQREDTTIPFFYPPVIVYKHLESNTVHSKSLQDFLENLKG